MKIPSNKILAGLGLIGGVATALSTYWIGRRDELNQLIDLGLDIEDGSNFREMRVFDKRGNRARLFIRTEE